MSLYAPIKRAPKRRFFLALIWSTVPAGSCHFLPAISGHYVPAEAQKSKIEPANVVKKIDAPECCVITFFADVIADLRQSGKLKQIAVFYTATVHLPIFETEYQGKKIAIVQGFLGAAGSAAQLEELIVMGFSKFIVCGAAGVLQKGIQVGHLVVPDSAVRDEGASYHYLEPSREVDCNKQALSVIENHLQEKNIPYIRAKTWTTDAFYRETEDKIALRVAEGCVTVEMEAAAFFAGKTEFAGND